MVLTMMYNSCRDSNPRVIRAGGLEYVVCSSKCIANSVFGFGVFVRHAFEHALAAAHGGDAASDAAGCPAPPDADEVAARFERQVAPSLVLASRIGPMHTAATYVNLASLLLHDPPKRGATIGVFSYGSGAAATISSTSER